MSTKPARRRKRISEPDGGFKDIWVWYCHVCDSLLETQYEFNEHLSKESHAFRWCLNKFEKKRKNLIKERHGICIEIDSENKHIYNRFKGVVEVNLRPFETCKFHVEVVNLMAGVGGDGGGGPNEQKKGRTGLGGSGVRGPVILHRIVSLVDGPVVKDSKEVSHGNNNIELGQGSKHDVTVEIGALDVSIYRYPIVFILQPKSMSKLFFIIRELVIKVSSGEKLVNSTMPEISPFQGLDWVPVTGTYEAITKSGAVVSKINDYPIPINLVSFFASGLRYYEGMPIETQNAYHRFNSLVTDGVTRENYADYFHMLLHYDEFEAQRHIEKFNMTGVHLMLAEDDNVELEVPGLEEKRPSLLENDMVYIRFRHGPNPEDIDSIQYEGKISKINRSTIWIECRNGLTSLVYPGAVFDVRFGFNRFSVVIEHRSIENMVERDLLDYVFPDENLVSKVDMSQLPKLGFFNKNVENNPEQKQAVINILLGSSMSAPYIVFGPPGTGKTITIVEAIMQVYKMCTDSVILVSAPSNAACDLLTEKLLQFCDKDSIYRIHSRSRDIESIPSCLHPCSNISDGAIGDVSKTMLMTCRILCCTLITAGKLSNGWIPKESVTHVFIDECGQAVEPEAVAVIAGILGYRGTTINQQNGHVNGDTNCHGMLVLAGDPLQLGPVCASLDASKIGLGLSLLERLMKRCSLYQRKNDAFNPLFITKLVRNFRSHPDILLLPNELFYDNELEAHSKTVLQDTLCKATFPVHFHSVVGGDEREGSSPSYFNLREVEVVIMYVKSLLAIKGAGKVNQNEIGVLTPYTRQVYKLKQALRKKNWVDVEVGSTEIYQGREKRVMIISTVRSAKSAIEVDSHYRMGFLSDPKRFNVAMTRAQARLIIVGDPYVLARNENWLAVMNLTQEHNTFVGAPYIPRDDNYVARLHPLFKQLTLSSQ
ncbi:putative helicase mov-10-B.1 [Hetaerina americana]|uniref:putative helicase mov-10-B.1 n=1 Tax=Hetaerina americana TaxID=62018 RepID=UPI003A7F4874